jgi:hypothetical protein
MKTHYNDIDRVISFRPLEAGFLVVFLNHWYPDVYEICLDEGRQCTLREELHITAKKLPVISTWRKSR